MTARACLRPAVFVLSLVALGAVSLLLTRPAGAQSAAPTAAPVAQVVSLEGEAAVVRFGASEQLPLTVKRPLLRADTVHTRAASSLRIAFENETVVTLGELASLRVTQIAEPGRGSTRLTVLAGAARFVVQPGAGAAPSSRRGRPRPSPPCVAPSTSSRSPPTAPPSSRSPEPSRCRTGAPTCAAPSSSARARAPPSAPTGAAAARPWGDRRRRSIDERTRLP